MPFELILQNLFSPAVLCFMLGGLAAMLKSDLRVPPQMLETISMYLLFAIGLKGGFALQSADLTGFAPALAATLALGTITPILAFAAAKSFLRLDRTNAAAVAAHYGSVSAVTFMAAISLAKYQNIPVEGFIYALLVVLEIPGIVIALLLAKRQAGDPNQSIGAVLHEAVTGKSIILLAGGMAVAWLSPAVSHEPLQSVFINPFQGVLVFFLLELGYVAFSRLKEIEQPMPKLMVFGIIVPLAFGMIGLGLGHWAGLSAGGMAMLAVMAASASYIAAPAAVGMALPAANPAIYLTLSISITLPFNIGFGIPLYFALAQMLGNG